MQPLLPLLVGPLQVQFRDRLREVLTHPLELTPVSLAAQDLGREGQGRGEGGEGEGRGREGKGRGEGEGERGGEEREGTESYKC